MNNVTIYGLYDKAEECRYIGATVSPKIRATNHRLRFPLFEFRVIKICPRSRAYKEEVRLILKHKRLGGCDFNKKIGGRYWKRVKGVSIGNRQIRLSSKNLNRVNKIRQSMLHPPLIPISVPALVNHILDAYGIKAFLESQTYRDATK